jgi:hypothetical protein
VIGKQYFVRQATILFGIAKATKDPKMSAALNGVFPSVKCFPDLGEALQIRVLSIFPNRFRQVRIGVV